MRLSILAIGHARGTSEGVLCGEFLDRAIKMGRNMGFTAVTVEEVSVGKARDAATRMADEATRLAVRLPEGAHIVLLDAKGKGMTSEDFAEMLGSLRDVGTRDLVFVIGGPDGLAPLPGKKAGRSLAFGLQTWPHLLARALLLEQVYRAMTILAGLPITGPRRLPGL
jgi:23S rRNA (pseudouridine1915-N3)-methyltransferase